MKSKTRSSNKKQKQSSNSSSAQQEPGAADNAIVRKEATEEPENLNSGFSEYLKSGTGRSAESFVH